MKDPRREIIGDHDRAAAALENYIFVGNNLGICDLVIFADQNITNSTTMKSFLVLLLSAACLLGSEGKTVEIIHGNEARPHSRPYMALIIFDTEIEEMICGGTLIAPNWILTAGHCEKQGSRITVLLGAHSMEGNEKGIQRFHISESIQHPKYNNSTFQNDLRLIQLRRKAKIGKTVKLFPLPDTFDDVDAGMVCEAAGWGLTEKNMVADYLREVNLTVLNREKCQNYWGKSVNITNNLICTVVGPKGQDTCTGDSGGPLICKGIYRGVTSFGESVCGKPKHASVFTRLTMDYVSWINKTIAANL
ncbi:mast cell protease 3-like [Leptodactylus fuscus]|uniref:mast cell protease 3-like n=1 Tax=Leptodactylus fuscus TaxID=238119 RepID=UPI003F4EE45F